jgi:peptidyl-prolyl cis-trans isomerase C
MTKTLTGIALALLGVGYGVFSMMDSKGSEATAPAAEVAKAASEDNAKVEPAAEEKTHSADDPVVAKVDGAPIYKTDVLEFIKTLPPQMQQAPVEAIFPMASAQVISGKIVDKKAVTEGTENSAEVAKRLAEAKVQIIRAVYAEQAIQKEFSESMVQKAYDDMVSKMPKIDEVHARHILVDTDAQAKDIIKKLDGGAKFEDLAKEFSKDQSNSASGGDLGYFAQSDMVKEFADAAFALKANEFTKAPVKTQFGFHIIQSLDKRVRPAPKFDEVKGQVEGQVRRDILNKLVEQWRNAATIEQFDMNGNPLPKPEEKKAEEAKPAEEPKAE